MAVKHILVADDSATESHFLRVMLEKNGYRVTSVNDGEAVLQNAKRLRPDLILMDVVMPRVNGFQATRELAKHPETQHIPIIIISSKSQDSDVAWGFRQGARDYIKKPFTEAGLLFKINAALSN